MEPTKLSKRKDQNLKAGRGRDQGLGSARGPGQSRERDLRGPDPKSGGDGQGLVTRDVPDLGPRIGEGPGQGITRARRASEIGRTEEKSRGIMTKRRRAMRTRRMKSMRR